MSRLGSSGIAPLAVAAHLFRNVHWELLAVVTGTRGLVEKGGKETGDTRIKGMMKSAGDVVEAPQTAPLAVGVHLFVAVYVHSL